MDANDPVKFSLLTLTNSGAAARRLSVFAYNEWVLGPPREGFRLHVVTELDAASGAILARNPYNSERPGTWPSRTRASRSLRRRRIARRSSAATARSRVRPRSTREALSGRFGAGLDPCAALQVSVSLAPGETRALVFLLGEAQDTATARELVARHGSAQAAASLRSTRCDAPGTRPSTPCGSARRTTRSTC